MNKNTAPEMMWAMLIHLGSNMWSKPGEKKRFTQDTLPYHETMFADKDTFRKVIDFMAECGMNTAVIDMGEGVKLDSHPELAIEGSWTKDEFKVELDHMRSIGITPIPKFNFSCAHNAWMKDYGYMVSSPEYHQFCRDIIAETVELFDHPKFFHLGLQDENAANQEYFPVAVVRNSPTMIADANVLFKACLDNGTRPWIWLDTTVTECFGGVEKFFENVPKEVLISNLYGGNLSLDYPSVPNKDQQAGKIHMTPSAIFRNPEKVQLYHELDKRGYQHVPTCTTYFGIYGSATQAMKYCKTKLENQENILGYIATPWCLTDADAIYSLKSEAYLFKNAKDTVYADAE